MAWSFRFAARGLAAGLAAAGIALASAPASQAAGSALVKDLNNGATPVGLAEAVVGEGVSVSDVTYTGSNRSAGSFANGGTSIGYENGIILDTGKVETYTTDPPCSKGVEGPNTCYEATALHPGGPAGEADSSHFGLPGDLQLSELSGQPTFDASILEFDFVPHQSEIKLDYVFASEAYDALADTEADDLVGIFVNGVDCALVPGTDEPVSVDTINDGNDEGGSPLEHHPELFRDNVNPEPTIDTQFNGLTTPLICHAAVKAGQTNHMKLAVADAAEENADTGVFVAAGSLTSGPEPTTITTLLSYGFVDPSGERVTVKEGTAVRDSASLSGQNAAIATGTVSYDVYSDDECKDLVAEAGSEEVSGGSVPFSTAERLPPGTYYWQASYGGDENNDSSASVCGSEVETVTPVQEPTTLTTSLSGGGSSGERITVQQGTAVSDAATLEGAHAFEAAGTVSYRVYSDDECKDLVAEAGTVGVSAGVVPASGAETLAPGIYYWRASYDGDEYNEPSTSTCGAEVETVTPVVSSESPSVEAESFQNFNRPSAISTTEPGDLVLAFVSAGGPATGGQTAKVSGGGLKWTLVARENAQLGDSEVWEARAKGALHGASISAKLRKHTYDVAIDVVAFRNAPGVGAVGTFHAPSGAPEGAVKTTVANSWVWAVGNDWDASIPRTPGLGQAVVAQGFDAGGDTYWVQRTDFPTPKAGTEVEINDIEPTLDPYNLVLVEVK